MNYHQSSKIKSKVESDGNIQKQSGNSWNETQAPNRTNLEKQIRETLAKKYEYTQ